MSMLGTDLRAAKWLPMMYGRPSTPHERLSIARWAPWMMGTFFVLGIVFLAYAVWSFLLGIPGVGIVHLIIALGELGVAWLNWRVIRMRKNVGKGA